MRLLYTVGGSMPLFLSATDVEKNVGDPCLVGGWHRMGGPNDPRKRFQTLWLTTSNLLRFTYCA